MKRTLRSTLALLLCTALLLAALPFGATAAADPAAQPAEGKRTDCGADCPFFPTIIVPGLGQSSTIVIDENGEPVLDKDGNKISSFPAYVQLGKLIGKLLVPALLSLVTQRDVGLSKAGVEAIDLCFGLNACDLNGQLGNQVMTEKFPYSYAEYSKYDRDVVNHHIPFEQYPTDLPRDHLYYFEYNSFGNHIDLANELYDFIQMVKAQTGHDKVNLVPLSQGASITSAMIEYHPEIKDQLHKILFVVPALDGSKIIGDVFNDRIAFLDADYLYNGFLEDMRLLDEHTARLIEVAARVLPDELIVKVLTAAVNELVGGVMIRSTSMWALCPSEDYPSAAEKYLSAPEMAEIRAQTDRYYQVQLHARDNIAALQAAGVQIFDLAEYDFPLIDVGESWNKQNGDFIIQLDSTSMGATAANCGETLPAGYVQQNTHCSNPDHNHISPDNVIDASTGLLPDTTFYFKGNRHDLTQHNDTILKIAMDLIAHDDLKDVFTDPDLPQFLPGRNVSELKPLLAQARALDTTKLPPAKADAINDAIIQAEAVLADTSGTMEDIDAASQALTDALVAVGEATVETEKDPTFLRNLSQWLYQNFGPNGYSEFPRTALKKLFDKLLGR